MQATPSDAESSKVPFIRIQSIRGDETVSVNKASPASPQLTARSRQSAQLLQCTHCIRMHVNLHSDFAPPLQRYTHHVIAAWFHSKSEGDIMCICLRWLSRLREWTIDISKQLPSSSGFFTHLYPLDRRVGGPQSRCRQCGALSSDSGLDNCIVVRESVDLIPIMWWERKLPCRRSLWDTRDFFFRKVAYSRHAVPSQMCQIKNMNSVNKA
jgi:hypothetical protein